MMIEPTGDNLAFLIKAAGEENADIIVRPIETGDRHLLQLGFDQLSERSRYYRFLMRREALTEEELDFLTAKNTDDHVALGALDLHCSPPRPVGIARYVRNDDAPETAEIAITITDRYQGRGVGITMIAALTKHAAEDGIKAFTAQVHHENGAMLHIFDQIGGHAEPASKGEAVVSIPIHRDAMNYPINKFGDRMREVQAALTNDGG